MLEVLLLDELELPHAVKVTVSASPKIVKLTALSHFFISITPVELYFFDKKSRPLSKKDDCWSWYHLSFQARAQRLAQWANSLSTLTGTTRYWLANAHQYHLETIFVSLSDRFTPTNGSLFVAITLLISSQCLDIEASLQD